MQHAAAEAGAVGEHHAVEQRAVSFLDGIHLLANLRELPHVKLIKLLEVAEYLFVPLIVGPAVVENGFRKHILEHQRRVPAFRRDHHGADSSEIGLQREDHQVAHHLNVFIAAHGGPEFFRLLNAKFVGVHLLLGDALDLLFDSSHGVHVLVELVAIQPPQSALQILRIGTHEVEHAGIGLVFFHVEQALENLARILDRPRHVPVAVPRDVIEIHRLLVVGEAVARQLERTERRGLAGGVGNDLVDGALEWIPGRRQFIGRGRAQVTRSGLRVAVGAGHFHAVEIGEERNLFAHRLQRLQCAAECEVVPGLLRVPCLLSHAVGHVEKGHALGRRCAGPASVHHIEKWQR